jgi:hypothetical protein
LKEFKEVPEGYVSVFTVVDKKDLDEIASEGLLTEKNLVTQRHLSTVETLFDQIAREKGIGLTRTTSIFAYPRHPLHMQNIFQFDTDTQALLELKVDPKKAIVTDMATYNQATNIIRTIEEYNPLTDPLVRKPLETEEDAREWAEDYWSKAKRLDVYLGEGHKGYRVGSGPNDKTLDYEFPEILIGENVPPGSIREVPVTDRETKRIRQMHGL